MGKMNDPRPSGATPSGRTAPPWRRAVAAAPHGLPELISIAALTALHLWKRNVLLSIGVGTALYMLLVQVVFV